LVAGDVDLLGVDHDDVVAGVDVRGVDGLVLAAEATRDLGAQAAEGLAGGVDHEPVALDGLVLGGKGLHQETLRGDWSGWLRGPSPAELRLAFSRSGNARGGIVPARGLHCNLLGLAGAGGCRVLRRLTTWWSLCRLRTRQPPAAA